MPGPATINPPVGTNKSPDHNALGQWGADWIDDTQDHTSNDWVAITAILDTTFAVLEGSTVALNGAAPANLNGKVLSRGLTIFGRFTRMQLSSGGAVIAYRRGLI